MSPHRLAIYVTRPPYDSWDEGRPHAPETPIYLELSGYDLARYAELCKAEGVNELPGHLYLSYGWQFERDGQQFDFTWRQDGSANGPLHWATAEALCALLQPDEEGDPLNTAVYACLKALPPDTRIIFDLV